MEQEPLQTPPWLEPLRTALFVELPDNAEAWTYRGTTYSITRLLDYPRNNVIEYREIWRHPITKCPLHILHLTRDVTGFVSMPQAFRGDIAEVLRKEILQKREHFLENPSNKTPDYGSDNLRAS